MDDDRDVVIDPELFDVHDGRLISLTSDFLGRTIRVDIDAYLSSRESRRSRVEIEFSGVSNMYSTVDFMALVDNFGAGNVAYWHVYLNKQCCIHLQSGFLRIDFAEMKVRVRRFPTHE